MSKTSTKKGLNRKHTSTSTATDQTHSRHAATAASVADKRVMLGNTVTGAARKPRKKTRKKLSRQQAAETRDMLDAEFRDLRRAGVSTRLQVTVNHAHTLQVCPRHFPPLLFCFYSQWCCVRLRRWWSNIPFFPFTAYARVCPAACRQRTTRHKAHHNSNYLMAPLDSGFRFHRARHQSKIWRVF